MKTLDNVSTVSSPAITSSIGLLLLCVLCGGLNCEEPSYACPSQPAPTCTVVCPETPIVWSDCDGIRRVHVPPGWALEDYEP